jgi:hypothetical protein
VSVSVVSGKKYIYEYSEREFLGVTLLGKAKRDVPVRTEPHPTPGIAEGFPRRLVNFPYKLCGKIPGQCPVALRGNKRFRLRSKAGRLTYS